MSRITSLTLIAATLLSFSLSGSPLAQYLNLQVIYNSNLTSQQPVSFLFAFSASASDNQDPMDLGNQNSLLNNGDYVMPFSLNASNAVVATQDGRPSLTTYKTIQLGFETKNPATIQVTASAYGTSADTMQRPAYAWIECISTGVIYRLFNDTLTLNVPANQDFTVDYVLHTGPAVPVTVTDEGCYLSYTGALAISNAGVSNWLLKIYQNNALVLSTTVAQADTTLDNLTSANYTVVASVNGILQDSTVYFVNGLPQIIPAFTADNYNPTTSDLVTFTNTSSNAATYYWSFGDGFTDITTSPSHQYQYSGAYEVELTASDDEGCSETVIDSVVVTGSGQGIHQAPHVISHLSNDPTNTVASHARKAFAPVVSAVSMQLNISQEEAQQMHVTLLSTSGQLISTTVSSDTNFTLSVPATGVYIVYMSASNGEAVSQKIVVNQ